MSISIRSATSADAELIADFNNRLAMETEDRTLNNDLIVPGVDALLHDAAKGRYWVALAEDRIVGQIGVTYEWSDWRNGMLWWIQSVYVHEDFRRRGIFSALYRHVESLAAAEANVRGLRLYLEKENRGAQKTYESLGISVTGYRVMETIFEKGSDQAK
jgi:ribosomal protein S18 acetylase RimI-like enzyme